MEIIEHGLKLNSADVLLNYNKAMLLYQNNRREDAIKHLRYVIQLAPNEIKLQEKLKEWLNTE